MLIITSTINIDVYIEILDNFLILLREYWIGDDEVIFQNDNASRQTEKRLKLFFRREI